MRDFFKYTFASVVGTVVGLGVLAGMGIGGLLMLIGMAASSARDADPKVEDQSMLVLDMSLNITDAKPTSTTAQALSDALSDRDRPDSIDLRSVLESIEAARKDERIVGIYLHGSSRGTSNGFATLKEVRKAMESFRESGKTIVAYDQDWSEREYYLGSVAETLFLNPLGVMELNGLSSETTFLAGGLEKYGIGVQVTRAGKYKSAVEPFLLTESSPESREQTAKLLGDIWGDFLTTVSEAGSLNPQQLQQVVDTEGILIAAEARDKELVDRLAYFDEVVAHLKELTDSEEDDRTFRQISLQRYAAVAQTDRETNNAANNQVAIVYAEGEIVDGPGSVTQVGGDRLAKQLRQLRQDEDVKAVVLRVNSPGGSATASEVIQREVRLMREVKPIVVSMGNIAASGGYWISTSASKIFAQPNTITGSIGVFGLLLNVQELGNNNGITWDVVKTGRYADLGTITRPKTPEELAIAQQVVDRIYQRFLTIVSESRNLSRERVNQIAQGRVWSGEEAKRIALVDELGGLEDALNTAAELAELGDNWKVKDYTERRSFEQLLLEKLSGSRFVGEATPTTRLDPLTAQLQNLYQDLAILRNLNDPVGAYARIPFTFRIR
ncbi:signal peptide peptidase SppA [Phormidium sp. CCY1219]|uniref:signal peptide peptidase SppA n=1 Tax=Phormidium sp. CCY1219 TaxID=2886104 RepID=UPI002D1F8391|nr:signal peptide peptidase SppA [Phormidium sp. CCY1219]MEB3831239.1 signal peptide peptidase SppA [Phormidium sp. CCY1219]